MILYPASKLPKNMILILDKQIIIQMLEDT